MNVITLYSTGCPMCMALKKMLDDKGITYSVENDVEKMKSLGIQHVPVLEKDGKQYSYPEAVRAVMKNEI